MDLPFSLPPMRAGDAEPVWRDTAFVAGPKTVRVLDYGESLEGWSDELTDLHERAAGAAHPIDVASRRDALRQLRRWITAPRPVILEIGCSSGHLLGELAVARPDAILIGADVVRAPLDRLGERLPHVPLLRFDIESCPIPSGSVDAIVMLNVLEHVRDDAAALKQAHRVLRPGGFAIVEVPAGPHLYDQYDRALRHFRRYRLRDLISRLEGAGFRVVRRSHLGFFVYPAFAVAKRRAARDARASTDPQQLVERQVAATSSSGTLRFALALESALGRWLSYPAGIRCLAVGQRVIPPGVAS